MNGLLGAQLGAQSGMASGGVMGYADLIRKKLMETIAPKSAETLKEETPQPTVQKDYTAGLTPPEIGGVPSKLEFKATPNRLSAFMVALGQIMQNKYNTERAKEEQAQGLYESRLKSGQALNTLQEELGMKQRAEQSDPMYQATLKEKQAMFPLKQQAIELANQTKLQKMMGGGGKSTNGSAQPSSVPMATDISKMTDDDIRKITNWSDEKIKVFRASKKQEQLLAPYLKTIEHEQRKTEAQMGIAFLQGKYGMDYETAAKKYYSDKSAASSSGTVQGQWQGMENAMNPPPPPVPVQQAPVPQAETKVINGVTYQKTNGGWQKIK